jgi:amino acid transporter
VSHAASQGSDQLTREPNRLPPSGATARAWSLAALVLPIVLPLAVVYARRARREANLSTGEYSWPQRLIDRPVVFHVVVWVGFFSVMFAMMAVLSLGFDVSPV